MACRFSAVLFDVGQTLICTAKSVGEVYAEIARKYGVDVVPETLNENFRRLWAERRATLHAGINNDSEREWWYDLVADSFACAGQECRPPKDEFETQFADFFDEVFEVFTRPSTWCIFEDVAPVLDTLREMGIRLAVVSNWDSRLELLLRRLELRDRFEFVLTSARAGYRKPDPRIFQVALDRLQLPANVVAYVGDSYEDDFVGARNAGITPVLIDREGESPYDIPTIRSLTDVPAFLCAG